MEARMVTLTPKPGHVDDLSAFWDDTVVAEIAGQQGNRGFVLLKDVAHDRVVGVSLWASTADVDAAAPIVRAHMASIADHLASPPEVTRVEVAAVTSEALTR
jgi:heme-degrading monooxygenase HmoA